MYSPHKWIQLFLLRRPFRPSTSRLGAIGQHSYLTAPDGDPYEELLKLTHEEYDELFAEANREYNSIVASDNPDLSRFAKKGGKMITWHGLADDLIPSGGSVNYYDSVLEHFSKYSRAYQLLPAANNGDDSRKRAKIGNRFPNGSSVKEVEDFYRLYLAPGVSHCMNGPGPYPGHVWDSAGALDHLMSWVENGTVPETLPAVSNGDGDGRRIKRPLARIRRWRSTEVRRGRRWKKQAGCVKTTIS